jgi:Family of unknown function (DUF6311)
MTPRVAAAVAGAAAGALLVWIASVRLLDPREAGWLMQGSDWQIHFLGWHLFRNEPWHWPPGRIAGYLEPLGSAIGLTDSLPLLAFGFKPFAPALSQPFQYFGLWFLACYILQGVFGALVLSTWTERTVAQVLGGFAFALMPTFLARIAHPALCGHWLLLWALWLNWRATPRGRYFDVRQHAALGIVSGLVHPYLAAMVLALLGALAAKRVIEDSTRWAAAVAALATAVVAVVSGWFLAGMFSVAAPAELGAMGVGDFSMNLLSPINSAQYSSLLPGLRAVSFMQLNEGFQYFGVGFLVLCIGAALLTITRPVAWRAASVPLLVVLIACALFSIAPRVSLGTRVLADFSEQMAPIASTFRVTGRFFWPVAYALVAAALGVVASRLGPRAALTVLSASLVLQVVDLHGWLLRLHQGSHGDAFYEWRSPLTSREWGELLPNYKHLHLLPPQICGGHPVVSPAAVGYLAGLYGLGINDAVTARFDISEQVKVCERLRDDVMRGALADDTAYLLPAAAAAELLHRTGDAVRCREIDQVNVCVTTRSILQQGRSPE